MKLVRNRSLVLRSFHIFLLMLFPPGARPMASFPHWGGPIPLVATCTTLLGVFPLLFYMGPSPFFFYMGGLPLLFYTGAFSLIIVYGGEDPFLFNMGEGDLAY